MSDHHARLVEVYDATTRYLQDLDRLASKDFAEPTVLPGWTRAHVVAHVALNALGNARALIGVAHGTPLPVYDSNKARDADIEETAKLPFDELRELSFDACGRFKVAAHAVRRWDAMIERTPGGPTYTVSEAVDSRWREVAIHHVDLGIGFGPADWSPSFTSYIFDLVVEDRAATNDLLLRTPEGDVPVGPGTGAVISGPRPELAYWLLGRDAGQGLSGELPTLGPWRPTPVK